MKRLREARKQLDYGGVLERGEARQKTGARGGDGGGGGCEVWFSLDVSTPGRCCDSESGGCWLPLAEAAATAVSASSTDPTGRHHDRPASQRLSLAPVAAPSLGSGRLESMSSAGGFLLHVGCAICSRCIRAEQKPVGGEQANFQLQLVMLSLQVQLVDGMDGWMDGWGPVANGRVASWGQSGILWSGRS